GCSDDRLPRPLRRPPRAPGDRPVVGRPLRHSDRCPQPLPRRPEPERPLGHPADERLGDDLPRHPTDLPPGETATQRVPGLSGDEDAEGTAEFLPFGCLYQDLETTTIALTGLYDLEDLHLMVSVAFVADTGEVDPESIEVGLQHGTESTLATLGRLTGAGLSGEEDFDESEMLAAGSYNPGDDVDAEVTLSSQDPLTGTITVSGLVNDTTGAELSLTTGFRCTL